MSVKKSISFPDDLDELVNAVLPELDRTYSNFVIHAVRGEIKRLGSKYPAIARKLKSDIGFKD